MPHGGSDESSFPGLSLRRCPSCLQAVPKQSIRCLLCWGYFMTEEDSIEEIRVLKTTEEDPKKEDSIALSRRVTQDVELDVDGEIIRMPC